MDDSEDSNQPVLPSVNGFYNLLKTGSMILVKEEPSELPNDMIEDVIAEQEQFNGASLRLQNDAPMPLQSDAPTEPQNDAPMLLQSDAPTEAQNDAPMLLLSDASLMLRSPRRIQNNDSTPLQNDAHIPLQSHVAMHLPSDASMQLDNVGSTQQRGDAHLQQSDATIQLLNDAPLKLQSNGFTQLRSDAHLQLQSDAHLQLQSDASIQIQNDASTQPQISLCKTEPDCDYMEPILIDEIKTEGDYLNEDEMPVENTLHDTSNAAVREPACDESDAIFIKTEFPEACTKTEPTEVKSTCLSMDNRCIIEKLLERKFSLRNFDEKLEIVKNGRPCPELPELKTKHKGNKERYVRKFRNSQYKMSPWITGCENLNKLFCWPCLLFSNESSVWNTSGYSDPCHLSAAKHKHQSTKSHLKCFLQCNLFGKERIDIAPDLQKKANIIEHNKRVKLNREILKRLIDAVCYLSKQELPFRGHNESEGSFNKGNYLELLETFRTYDSLIDSHLKNATVFRGTSPAVQNDIIHAINDVILDVIKKEINEASFVSFLLDETSDVRNKSELSTVFRYVRNGVSREHFIGFSDVSSDRTANGLFNHVKNIVEEFKIADKLVGQTYDGASVMSGHLNGLQSKVIDAYPRALFTHCYAHVLNLALQQGLSNIKECRIFFQTLSELPAFFSHSSKRTDALYEFVEKKLPSLAPTRWNFSSKLLHTAKEQRKQLIEFFEHIMENPEEWDNDAVLKVQGFLKFMTDFNTVLLFEIFSKLFSYTDLLYNILQTTKVDIMYCGQKVRDTLLRLQEDRQDFEPIWNLVTSLNKEDDKIVFKKSRISSNYDSYRRLYYEIIDNIVEQVKTRFGSFSKLTFFELLSHQSFGDYKKKFPQKLLNNLRSAYGTTFDYVPLKAELSVIYSSPEFQGLPIFKLIKFIVENELGSGFKEVYKLAELILTIPASTSFVERSFSALKRIHTYCRSTQSEDRSSDLGLISIEKELLYDLRLDESFYDKVIEKFLAKEKRIELIFK